MRKIPLGMSGKEVAIVDDKDFSKIMQYMWHKSVCGGAQRRPRKNGKRKVVFMHQVIKGVVGKKRRIIHLDGNRLNNRRSNLKIMGRE